MDDYRVNQDLGHYFWFADHPGITNVFAVQFPSFFPRNCAGASSRLRKGNDTANFACNDYSGAIRVSSSAQIVQREYQKMEDRKFRMNNSTETKVVSKDIRESLELNDKDTYLKLQALANIFSGAKDYPEEFHQLYVQPLLESGLNLEDSLEMLVEGVIRPN
jgi:hypothetical protein